MKKARNYKFSPIEHEYTKKYGKMPDRHFADLIHAGYTSEEAGRIINDNVNEAYREMKERHEKQKELDNPFLKSEVK